MAESNTTRFGVRRWTDGGDTPQRAEFDTSMANLETLAAGFLRGTFAARPAAAAANQGFLYEATDTGVLYWSTGSAWLGIAMLAGAAFSGVVQVPNGTEADPGLTFGAATHGLVRIGDGLYYSISDKNAVGLGVGFLSVIAGDAADDPEVALRDEADALLWRLLVDRSDADRLLILDASGNRAMQFDDGGAAGFRAGVFETLTTEGAVSGANTLDLSGASVIRRIITGNTTFSVTPDVTTASSAGELGSFVLHLANGGDFTVTWPATFEWPDDTPPTLSTDWDVIVGVADTVSNLWRVAHVGAYAA